MTQDEDIDKINFAGTRMVARLFLVVGVILVGGYIILKLTCSAFYPETNT